METFEGWFIIKRIDLAHGPAQADMDGPSRPGRMVGGWIAGFAGSWRCPKALISFQEGSEGGAAKP